MKSSFFPNSTHHRTDLTAILKSCPPEIVKNLRGDFCHSFIAPFVLDNHRLPFLIQ
jgi:hypothetical protein